MAANSYTADELTPCPKCGVKALRLLEDSGSDDYGDLEGAREICENPECNYDTGWCVGRC